MSDLHTQAFKVKEWSRTLDDEREYLESLLSSRFNFYFIFSGAAAAGISQLDPGRVQSLLFMFSAAVSLLFWRSLFRTYVLAEEIILEIEKSPNHPIAIGRRRVAEKRFTMLGSANKYFGQYIPGAITIGFFLLFAVSWA